MEWIVKIQNQPNQRVLVKLDPLYDKISAHGQYRIHNVGWANFSEEEHSIDIDLDGLRELLALAIKSMEKRIQAYEDINESFKVIKEIVLEELEDENKESQGGGLMM
jgi:hypothetical protein